MTDTLSPAQEQAIGEAAAHWVAQARTQGLSSSEKTRFLAWLRERPEHAAAADLAAQAWAAAPAAIRPEHRVHGAPTRRHAPVWRMAGAVCAALALAFGATLGWRASCHDTAFSTGPAQQRQIALADGTHVWLAPGSHLEAHLTALGRSVTLTGEAVFDVAHEIRGFSVTAQTTRVVDRGTLFAVNARQSGVVEVTLARGAIDLRDAASDALLASPRPGEQVRRDDQGLTVSPVDAQGQMAWRSGRLVFDRLPLGEALARFADMGGPRVRLADPGLARLPVSGAYAIADMDSFLAGLAALLPVRVSHGGQGYVIERR